MPTFLTREQLYRLIQRELPPGGAYPDGPATAFFSTAESDAAASGAASGYSSLERIYDNYFPQTALEKLDDWEIFTFGEVASAASGSLTTDERRNRIIAKIRERKDLSLFTMLTTILDVLPDGTFVQIFENCEIGSGWLLGESELGIDTYLGTFEKLLFSDESQYCNPTFTCWALGANELGITTKLCDSVLTDEDDLNAFRFSIAQFMAYSFEVRVFKALTSTERAEILDIIDRRRPARSVGLLWDDLALEDFALITAVTDVDRFDNVNCMAKDGTSDTGYIGRLVYDG